MCFTVFSRLNLYFIGSNFMEITMQFYFGFSKIIVI